MPRIANLVEPQRQHAVARATAVQELVPPLGGEGLHEAVEVVRSQVPAEHEAAAGGLRGHRGIAGPRHHPRVVPVRVEALDDLEPAAGVGHGVRPRGRLDVHYQVVHLARLEKAMRGADRIVLIPSDVDFEEQHVAVHPHVVEASGLNHRVAPLGLEGHVGLLLVPPLQGKGRHVPRAGGRHHVVRGVVRHRHVDHLREVTELVECEGRLHRRHQLRLRLEGEHAAPDGGCDQREGPKACAHIHHERGVPLPRSRPAALPAVAKDAVHQVRHVGVVHAAPRDRGAKPRVRLGGQDNHHEVGHRLDVYNHAWVPGEGGVGPLHRREVLVERAPEVPLAAIARGRHRHPRLVWLVAAHMAEIRAERQENEREDTDEGDAVEDVPGRGTVIVPRGPHLGGG
mmetsp:Transcript_21105/g.66841  ORF Transcript_21105/g.66841 Transcript_21105/m.66841 type:complete len:398 (+) Transcript_21105:119-1312(+)